MFHPEILPIEVQLPSLAIQLLFLGWVLRLVRRQSLPLRDSLLWIASTVGALLVTAFPRLLVAGANLVGVRVPSNAVFGLGLLYVALNVLSVTIAASSNAARVRRLSQECALLRAEIEALRAGRQGGPTAAGQP
jgi:hypothetical protein